jgi:hypothetical protein
MALSIRYRIPPDPAIQWIRLERGATFATFIKAGNMVHRRRDLKAVWVGDRQFAAADDIVDKWPDVGRPFIVFPDHPKPATFPRWRQLFC